MAEYEPVIGRWYRNLDDERVFEVVAVDDDTVEVQHADGDIEEFDLDAWYELPLEAAEAPDDYTGPFDDVDDDVDTGRRPGGDLDDDIDETRKGR